MTKGGGVSAPAGASGTVTTVRPETASTATSERANECIGTDKALLRGNGGRTDAVTTRIINCFD